MTLTNQEIINAYNALDALSDKELPILMTYIVVDNLEKLLKEFTVFDKARQKAKSKEEIKELLEIKREVDLQAINKQELIEAGVKISPIQLVSLKRLIDG